MWNISGAVYERYRKAGREAKQVMLNEFCLNTGYNRKYAIRLLNGPPPGKQAERSPRGRRPRYGQQVLSILAAIWEAAGYPWSVRLKALLPSVRKVTGGATIIMGTPPLQRRGRMPVFAYLSEDEAANAYLYLALYPPQK